MIKSPIAYLPHVIGVTVSLLFLQACSTATPAPEAEVQLLPLPQLRAQTPSQALNTQSLATLESQNAALERKARLLRAKAKTLQSTTFEKP